MGGFWNLRWLFVLSVALASVAGCKPKSVAEAEAKKNVEWLRANGTPAAIEALGRLADRDPTIARVLEDIGETDRNVYIAAWSAVERNAPWGEALLRSGLGNPLRSESAAFALPRKNPKLLRWIEPLEAAVSHDPGHGFLAAAVLASLGPEAVPAVRRRLEALASRATMCRGLASLEASKEARMELIHVEPEVRQEGACSGTLIQAAGLELDIAKWVGEQGEVFLLQGISNDDHVSCKFLVPAWVRAFETRPQDAYAMLSAPLSAALKRCPSELDESVSRALRSTSMRVFVMAAIDPYGGILARMPLTCREAGAVGQSDAPMLTRERGMTAFRHGCLHSK